LFAMATKLDIILRRVPQDSILISGKIVIV